MPAIDRTTAVGARFTGALKHISYQRLWAFSGGPFAADGWPKKNLHTDPETASRVGLDAPAASGTQLQGHVSELFVAVFGGGWLEHGTMDVRFVRGVKAGETLRAEAVVTARTEEGEAVRFAFDVQCGNEDGQAGLVGTATGVIR